MQTRAGKQTRGKTESFHQFQGIFPAIKTIRSNLLLQYQYRWADWKFLTQPTQHRRQGRHMQRSKWRSIMRIPVVLV